ncbi:gamma-glutamylcyclotransferase [Pseudonocardia sp. C8]|uniref:gamma-glutamylcyclotransferase family protein n=1 Tax=Pseudonocardia sp. C8 TaxID=2762759 RepID=UPI001642746B|nr:gamma-glutamylcyclotransferase family protein [Pseudonocardia sp. C8]MBC3189894.1 gamma-glutamylcyclotransferase [Pseudonocardia sp. C8]
MDTDTSPPWPDALFPADPYPGRRPAVSFVHDAAPGGATHPLVADRSAPSGRRVGDRCLDAWLAERGAAPLAGRVPVLAYGSNACPSKISWMRAERGLTGPVVVLRVRVEGLSAVWAAGLRVVDDQRPATLAAVPGAVEEHAVWLAAPEQVGVLDVVEGRAACRPRYRLARLAAGTVTLLDGGGVVDRPYAYVAPAGPTGDPRTDRRPLLVDGAPVPCSSVGQQRARALAGTPGADGIAAGTVDGVPHPDTWPSRVFVYGSLMPGQSAWPLIRGHAAPHVLPRPAFLPSGTVADTGQGYPALTLDGDGGVPGYVVELADPVASLPVLDRYEGPEYARIRLVTEDGAVCWAWLWTASRAGLTPLPRGWAARR